jgi:hypothetical protein
MTWPLVIEVGRTGSDAGGAGGLPPPSAMGFATNERERRWHELLPPI